MEGKGVGGVSKRKKEGRKEGRKRKIPTIFLTIIMTLTVFLLSPNFMRKQKKNTSTNTTSPRRKITHKRSNEMEEHFGRNKNVDVNKKKKKKKKKKKGGR